MKFIHLICILIFSTSFTTFQVTAMDLPERKTPPKTLTTWDITRSECISTVQRYPDLAKELEGNRKTASFNRAVEELFKKALEAKQNSAPLLTSQAMPTLTSQAIPTLTSEAIPTLTSEEIPTLTSAAIPIINSEPTLTQKKAQKKAGYLLFILACASEITFSKEGKLLKKIEGKWHQKDGTDYIKIR